MAAKEISVKKYVVRLTGEERERLETLIRKGKSPARRVLKARILLKADVSEAGKGWSDNRIIEALETSPSMVYRVRKQLVEEGFEAVLSRKPRAMPAVARIFDGEKEAKLIALACSKPPRALGEAVLRIWSNLPQDVQLHLFQEAVTSQGESIRPQLAVLLRDKDPRTSDPLGNPREMTEPDSLGG